ncbi:hypothetical protein [Flavobacterium sp. ENC]|uniref:hypothetical protein n=1 Tax=Flavobacterium sp. ENC TaxID=2897330 RepID=UPI001E41BADD|nr:hypothetical protein [Flavobacterium sp. ENC]MCD0464233.1 hypothetical protein [Flavobacterium sp. ENC]
MIEEIKKSINSIFIERVSSPFYGTLIVSWLIWNWKIAYLTFFVDQKKISITKIEFIVKNYSDVWHLVYWPLISTLILLTIIPFVTNGAYWLDLKFTTWRVNQKNEIEGKRLLTLEQSIKLRSELRELEENFEKLLDKKNEEIQLLKVELNGINIPDVSGNTQTDYFNLSDYNLLKDNNLIDDFVKCYKSLESGRGKLPSDVKDPVKEFLVLNKYISRINSDYYQMTEKGRGTYLKIFNNSFKGEKISVDY